MLHYDPRAVAHYHRTLWTQCPDQGKMDTGPMKDNIFGSEAFILLTKMEMHYWRNELQNFLQNLALDVHDGLHRKSTLAFIRHCSRVGGGGGMIN